MNALTILVFMVQTAVCEYDRRIITTLKQSKHNTVPTVVNGKPAKQGELPYLVSFKEPAHRLEPLKTVWKNLCGGTIIDASRVLTAAHCFEANTFYYSRYPSVLRVVAGDLSNDIIHCGSTETSLTSQWRRVKRTVLHKDFSFPANDIALAFVDVPWDFTSHAISPIRYETRNKDYTQPCLVAGYGRVGYSLKATISPILLKATIKTMPRSRCSLLWEMDMNTFVCTDSALSDVSRGDSGGPLVCYMETHELSAHPKDTGVLVGVVSGKNFDRTTLFTRVSAYHDWIERSSVDQLSMSSYLSIKKQSYILFIVNVVTHFIIR